MARENPNILYIMSDQHAARVMGCAGDTGADTPNLDRLAQRGTRFSHAYCPSPVCLPSRMSMLTGQRPHEQTCWTNDDILDSGRPTWLHALGAAGYNPVLFGRMHALGPDQLHGYVSRPIGDHSPQWPGVARKSLGQLAKTSGPFIESIKLSGPGQNSYQLMDADVLSASVDYLNDYAAGESDQPFCLTVSFMLPHPPYVASKDDFDAVKDHIPALQHPEPPCSEHSWIKKWREAKSLGDVTPEDVHRARASYYGLVRQLDRAIGTLLSTLDDIGATDNTLVIYVSDHGDHLGERGLFWKHTLYDDSVRVPLIMSWPGRIAMDMVCSHPVETGGLGNTILSMTGSPTLPNATMKSFADKLGLTSDESVALENAPIFIEYCTDDLPNWSEGFAVQQRAVIKGKHKFIYSHGYPEQLYDLDADTFEMNNLAEKSGMAEVTEELRGSVLENWNPEDVKQTVERRRADKALLKAWAEKTTPAEYNRWTLHSEHNFLYADR